MESHLVGVIRVTLEPDLHDLLILGHPFTNETLKMLEIFVVQVEVFQMFVRDESEIVVVIRRFMLQIRRIFL